MLDSDFDLLQYLSNPNTFLAAMAAAQLTVQQQHRNFFQHQPFSSPTALANYANFSGVLNIFRLRLFDMNLEA